MIGIELLDSRVVAVALDDGGNVLKRAAVDGGTDLGAAAIAALDEVRNGSSGAVGVASATPDAPAAASALAAVAKRFPGTAATAIPAGGAAAVGEAWGGAGRGADHVALFSVADHAIGGIVRHGKPIAGAHGRSASVAWLGLNPVE